MIRIAITAAALAASAAAAASAQDAPAEALAEVLTGSFTTVEQASTEGWGHVESELVRIWPEREDGVWLYQENAWLGDDPQTSDLAAKQRPYFQRLIKLASIDEATVIRTIYSMTEPGAVIGAYETPEAIAPEQLGDPSCSGPVERIAEGWWVADFPTCPSNLRGAVRTHSRSMHTPDGFANWDRGFDPDGNVVWGPATGGYIFKRQDQEQSR